MTIKSKITIGLSFIVSSIITILFVFFIWNFSRFRETEFQQRLKNRAVSTFQILTKVEEVNPEILFEIQENTVNQLVDESITIYDQNYQLIYANKNQIHPSPTIFSDKESQFYEIDGGVEVGEFKFEFNKEDYFIRVSAKDEGGEAYLNFLLALLGISYPFIILLIWLSSNRFIGKQFKPLDEFIFQLKNIDQENLKDSLPNSSNSPIEIQTLIDEFNSMLERIKVAYDNQAQFSAMVSHELKTPLARLSFQIQNLLNQDKPAIQTDFLKNQLVQINEMASMIEALTVLISPKESTKDHQDIIFVDEEIASIIQLKQRDYPNFKFHYRVELENQDLDLPSIQSSKKLFQMILDNLIQNGIKYSINHSIEIELSIHSQHSEIIFRNPGDKIIDFDNAKLFESFTRFNQDKKMEGMGLGLSLVKRILNHLGYDIFYNFNENHLHVFRIIIK